MSFNCRKEDESDKNLAARAANMFRRVQIDKPKELRERVSLRMILQSTMIWGFLKESFLYHDC